MHVNCYVNETFGHQWFNLGPTQHLNTAFARVCSNNKTDECTPPAGWRAWLSSRLLCCDWKLMPGSALSQGTCGCRVLKLLDASSFYPADRNATSIQRFTLAYISSTPRIPEFRFHVETLLRDFPMDTREINTGRWGRDRIIHGYIHAPIKRKTASILVIYKRHLEAVLRRLCPALQRKQAFCPVPSKNNWVWNLTVQRHQFARHRL